MLRIQRHPRSQEVTLVMGHRSSALQSRTLWLALAIAVAIHLTALLLFRFPILKISSLSRAPTALVELEPPPGSSAAQANWLPHASNQLLPAHLLLERRAAPTAPVWQLETRRSEVDTPLLSAALPTFRQAEQLEAIALPPPPPLPEGHTILRVHASGPLAQLPIIDDGIRDGGYAFVNEDRALHYSVIVDAHTGQICWFTLISPVEADMQMLQAGEAIVRAMRFRTGDDDSLFPTGEVEIHFINSFADDQGARS